MEQLGRIHYWMYNKICLTAEREQFVYDEAEKALGDLAEELHETAIDTYGAPVDPSVPLASVIDGANIHGWLARHLERETVREAAFICDLVDCGGAEGRKAAETAFAAHGAKCGDEAAQMLSAASTGEDVYRVMQSYYANGMPCDGGDEAAPCAQGSYAFYGTYRHQVLHWQTAGVSADVMVPLYEAWFTQFVKHAAPRFAFTKSQATGRPVYTIGPKP